MPRSIVARRSPIHGTGVFALKDLPAEYRVIQYRGKLISHDEADERYGGTVDNGHTFLFILNDHYVIDANRHGNTARWMNHSCEPNCEAVLIESKDGDPAHDRMVLETTRAIRAGEELTYDYCIQVGEPLTAKLKRIWACRCGSPKCSGTMLAPKSQQSAWKKL